MASPANGVTCFVAVVVWYNPQPEFVENIRSYAAGVDHVIVVDNSSADNKVMLKTVPQVQYVSIGYNSGIAAALNRGLEIATNLGADWILTMDQDSRFELSELEKLKSTVACLCDDTEIAVVGAITNPAQAKSGDRKIVPELITSGSLNRTTALQVVRGFSEKLFIDCVDFDLCFRLGAAGYKIVMDGSAKLDHRRGSPTTVTWRKKTYTTYNYSPTRYYYQVRNNLYLSWHFPEYRRSARKKIFKLLQSAIFLETGRLRKLAAIAEGTLHFTIGRYGPR